MLDLLAQSGEPLRPLTTWILKESPNVKLRSLQELWDLTAKRDTYRAEYLQSWNDTASSLDVDDGIDVLLTPVFPGAASPLDHSKYWHYSLVWNVLDYPSISFPVTKVVPDVDIANPAYQPRNKDDARNHEMCKSSILKVKWFFSFN